MECTKIIPKLNDQIKHWTRYVDDTFAFIKPNIVENVQEILNAYDMKIKFTYEEENESKISFLDVLLERTENNKLETSVYRKATNNNIYMNWHSYSPRFWKIGTLRSLIKRGIMISSNENILEKELNYLTKVFCEANQYPQTVTKSIIEDELEIHRQHITQSNTEKQTPIPTIIPKRTNNEEKLVQLNLPFGGDRGQSIIQKLKRSIEKTSKNNVKVRVTYTPCKLGSKFQVKDKTKFNHQHNVTYHVNCANDKCRSNYTGQIKCRIMKRILQHNSRDNASHILQHSKKFKHRRVTLNNVKILGKGYRSNFKRRISEALFIKELKPDLNIQKDAFKLKLYN